MKATGLGLIILLAAVAVGCEDECTWDPMVTENPDGSCVITSDDEETDCWGGETITCTPNPVTTGETATFSCSAVGQSDCGIPVETGDVTAPSCQWFAEEVNYEAYAEVWAECWDWDTAWFYW